MNELAIIGPTACGKSALAVELAQRVGGVVLSVDSLAVYRQIDIASAKPTLEERQGIVHFGFDVLDPDAHFSVAVFLELYREAQGYARMLGRPLIIVGGTGFYLKILREGLSDEPAFSAHTRRQTADRMADVPGAYDALARLDPSYAAGIAPGDSYRIERGWLLWHETGELPSVYRARGRSVPLAPRLPLYEIDIGREELRRRIALRTEAMLDAGLIDEVAALEFCYGRRPNAMKAIGIAEVLDYFDGKIAEKDLAAAIALHTGQLAKRQQTFNRGQFPDRIAGSRHELLPQMETALQGPHP